MSFEELKKRRDQITKIATTFGISNLRVFGSVARGTATSTSDLDLIVKVAPDRSLLDLIGFEQSLSQLLGTPVQAISERGVSRHLKDKIIKDAKPL